MQLYHAIYFFSCIGPICKLLESGSLNLRIAAGETVALVYELAYDNRLTLQGPTNVLLILLQEFANESGRHKGKREKKQQKSSFRDILKSVKVRNVIVRNRLLTFKLN